MHDFGPCSIFGTSPKWLLICTDSLDSIGILHLLHASESMHSSALLEIAGIILCSGLDFWVCHVKGKINVQADLLLCLLLQEYFLWFPFNHINWFSLPMGAVTSIMERELLKALGGGRTSHPSFPLMALSDLDTWASFLQAHSIEVPTTCG